MHSTRNWQDSFDRLERSRREEQRLREAEERQIREAEAAYARASLEVSRAEVASRAEPNGFMLAEWRGDKTEALVTAKAPAESPPARSPSAKSPPEKSTGTKVSPRKRAAPRRKARTTKSRTAKPRAAKPALAKTGAAVSRAAKPAVAKPAAARLPEAPASDSLLPNSAKPLQPAISLPRTPQPASAEPLLITPLPRSAALARYRKPGLFGLIGSWLQLAARRPKLPEGLRRPARKQGPPRDDVAALRAENKRLYHELEALKALQEVHRANTPPWVTAPACATTPAGDVLARPRRRDGILR